MAQRTACAWGVGLASFLLQLSACQPMGKSDGAAMQAVREYIEADERGDVAAMERMEWHPPLQSESARRMREYRRLHPLADPQTDLHQGGYHLVRVFDERPEAAPNVRSVAYEVATATGRTLKQRHFVRLMGGRWLVVQSARLDEYLQPASEIGVPIPAP
ncbi:MAG: hypothetical protein NTV70_13165 [Acidobacteria bacterium]|nr:hypothetical protein [Acidobacteriota bacterium]